jgi:preprotein translocase subunit YajC
MNSGMHGKITKMDEKTVTIEVDNNVRLKFEKGFINMELSKSLNPAPVVIDKEK